MTRIEPRVRCRSCLGLGPCRPDRLFLTEAGFVRLIEPGACLSPGRGAPGRGVQTAGSGPLPASPMRPSSFSFRRSCGTHPDLGLVGPPVDVRRGLGDRHRRLFHRKRAWRPEALPGVSPKKTWSGFFGGLLAGGDRRISRRLGRAAARLGPPVQPAQRHHPVPDRLGGEPDRGSGRVGPEAPLRREGFEPSHPGPWRRDGPARRLLGRLPSSGRCSPRSSDLHNPLHGAFPHHSRGDRLDRPLDGGCRPGSQGRISRRGRGRRAGRRALWRPWPDGSGPDSRPLPTSAGGAGLGEALSGTRHRERRRHVRRDRGGRARRGRGSGRHQRNRGPCARPMRP